MFLMGFHKGYETSSGLSQRKGNKINNLPGRPPGLIYSNPQSSAAQINLIRELLQAITPSNQREQISHGTYLVSLEMP